MTECCDGRLSEEGRLPSSDGREAEKEGRKEGRLRRKEGRKAVVHVRGAMIGAPLII